MASKPALETIEILGLADVRVPYLEQYFGLWLMGEEHFHGFANSLRGFDLQSHLVTVLQRRTEAEPKAAAGESPAGTKLNVTPDGIALVTIRGMMMKQESSFGSNTSTVAMRRQIRAAANSSDIKAILLHFETPGGTVAGTKELAADVAAAAAQKPVWAACEDLCASAGYWVASQAARISANEMASIGSIGTYGVVYDYSANAAANGVKVHVVRAGQYKGMGTPGSEITAEQLAYLQKHITEVNEHFLAGVSAGRKLPLEAVRGLADGRTHLATNAKGIGLIDAVESLDETLNQLRVSLSKPSRKTTMTADSKTAADAAANQPVAATLAEIRAACPGASSDFILAQLGSSATLAQATSAWMKQLSDDNAKLAKEKAEAEEKLKATATTEKTVKPGVLPVNAGAKPAESSIEDPIAAFNELVAAEMKTGKSRPAAHAAVCRKHPELRAAMVAAHNELHSKRK